MKKLSKSYSWRRYLISHLKSPSLIFIFGLYQGFKVGFELLIARRGRNTLVNIKHDRRSLLFPEVVQGTDNFSAIIIDGSYPWILLEVLYEFKSQLTSKARSFTEITKVRVSSVINVTRLILEALNVTSQFSRIGLFQLSREKDQLCSFCILEGRAFLTLTVVQRTV